MLGSGLGTSGLVVSFIYWVFGTSGLVVSFIYWVFGTSTVRGYAQLRRRQPRLERRDARVAVRRRRHRALRLARLGAQAQLAQQHSYLVHERHQMELGTLDGYLDTQKNQVQLAKRHGYLVHKKQLPPRPPA